MGKKPGVNTGSKTYIHYENMNSLKNIDLEQVCSIYHIFIKCIYKIRNSKTHSIYYENLLMYMQNHLMTQLNNLSAKKYFKYL